MRQLVPALLLTCLLAPAAWAQGAPALKVEDAKNPVVLIKTSLGDVYVELFPSEAPKTVQNFLDNYVVEDELQPFSSTP